MSRKDYLTDEQVEIEIERLKKSDAVKLARLEQRIKYAQRQKMYNLRHLEKRGKELMKLGITEDVLLSKERECEESDMY